MADYAIGGILRDGTGQMLITFDEPAGTPMFNNGLWVTPAGRIVATTVDPIAFYVHGWPVTVKGKLCVVLR